jgi:LA2681-like HEPN
MANFWGSLQEEVLFSELMDKEMIGEEVEKLRMSFRMCFGIFDKIAHGICYFFDLPKKKNENIYFENFWNTGKCPERWNKLKDLRNPHLVALYSIANDFNSGQGEFHFYKLWRNKLEHNNLILVDKTDEMDLLRLFDDEEFISKASFSFFKEQALHLLQICCSAIYSYAYVIRTESMQSDNEVNYFPFTIQPKTKSG